MLQSRNKFTNSLQNVFELWKPLHNVSKSDNISGSSLKCYLQHVFELWKPLHNISKSDDFWFQPQVWFYIILPFNPQPAEFITKTCLVPLLELSFITFGEIKMKVKSWSVNSIWPRLTARIFRLAWLSTGGKG
jgi:hypothetical protein